MKKMLMGLGLALSALLMTGCGHPVEIPTAHVGKIQTKNGFGNAEVRMPSKFRLDPCWGYCDRLVVLDVSDNAYQMSFETLIPADDLMLSYSVDMTLSVDPSKYDFVFANVPFTSKDDRYGTINQFEVFKRYVAPQLNTLLPTIVADHSIGEIASNRAEVNANITLRLTEALKDTPFFPKVVGLTNVVYPEVITNAKIASAERLQQEETVKAQRKLDLLTIATREEVAQKARAISLYEAETKALVADKLMSENMKFIEQQETLRKLAESTNKVFVPTGLLDDIAVTTPSK